MNVDIRKCNNIRKCCALVLSMVMAMLLLVVVIPVPSAIGDGYDDVIRSYLQEPKAREAAAILVSTGLQANGRDAANINADTVEFKAIRRLREIRSSSHTVADAVLQSHLERATDRRWGVSIAIADDSLGVLTVDETDQGLTATTFYPDTVLARCIESSSPDSDIVFDVPSYAIFSLRADRLAPMNDNAGKLLSRERPFDDAVREIRRRGSSTVSSSENDGAVADDRRREQRFPGILPLALTVFVSLALAAVATLSRKGLIHRRNRSRHVD